MQKQETKNIIVLGAGFCGLQVAKQLANQLKEEKDYKIILIDKRKEQVYSADLYEVGTAYIEEKTAACLRKLKQSTTIPIKKALKKEIDAKKVAFIADRVTGIDHESKKIKLKTGKDLAYEYLVVTLGSVTNYYGIDDLKKHSYPLKTLEQALELNCHIDQYFCERWKKGKKGTVNIVIGGGGFTGIEFACELGGFIKKTTKKYEFDQSDVKVTIIQSDDQFVGLGEKVSNIAKKRLKKFGVKPILNTRIAGYDGKKLTVCNRKGVCKRSMLADILVWTAGVKPHPRLQDFPILDRSGALETKPTLETIHYPDVYAGGDNALIFDPKKGTPVPKMAQFAVQEARTIAHNITATIKEQPAKTFHPVEKGFISPMGGKYYVFKKGNATISGKIPYLMKRVVDILYFSNYLPITKAIKKVLQSQQIFNRND